MDLQQHVAPQTELEQELVEVKTLTAQPLRFHPEVKWENQGFEQERGKERDSPEGNQQYVCQQNAYTGQSLEIKCFLFAR